MLIKYLILISFLNLVLSEAFAQVCLEDNNTIKYENIFNKCCETEEQQLTTQKNAVDPAGNNFTAECCVDYDHNYIYVNEQNVIDFKCIDFCVAQINSKEIHTKCTSYDYSKNTPLNNYNRQLIKTTVIIV